MMAETTIFRRKYISLIRCLLCLVFRSAYGTHDSGNYQYTRKHFNFDNFSRITFKINDKTRRRVLYLYILCLAVYIR